MANLQKFVTECESCGNDMTQGMLNLTGSDEIIIDFLDAMDFECDECGQVTYIEVQKFNP